MVSLSFKSIIFLNLNILAIFQEIHLEFLFSTKEFRLYQTHDCVLNYTTINHLIAQECLFRWIPEISDTTINESEQFCNWLKLCPQLAMKNPTNIHTEISLHVFHKQNYESISELKEKTSTCHPWEIKFLAEKINFFKNKCWLFEANIEFIRPTCDTAYPKRALISRVIISNGTSGKFSNNQPLAWTSPFPQPPLHIDSIFEFCDESFDSIALIRGELFVFKKQYLWRFRERLRLLPGHPIRVKEIFPFPKSFTGIDAAYENLQGYIYFFSGQQIFIYDGSQFLNKWPRTLQDLDIDAATTKIDAGFIWRKNKKTYLFTGTKFWRYNSETFQMDSGYPKEIAHWKGVSYPVDAVIQWKDGVTYFFVGNTFYRFDDKKVHIESGPLRIKEHWFRLSNNFKCPSGYDKQLNDNLNI